MGQEVSNFGIIELWKADWLIRNWTFIERGIYVSTKRNRRINLAFSAS